uniref:Uncharacterized protein n=1 Tax=Polynucleobacter necessarius subsp. necessarius (strain STIR1) TaxID=452638 RepID=B1XUG7_POLNS
MDITFSGSTTTINSTYQSSGTPSVTFYNGSGGTFTYTGEVTYANSTSSSSPTYALLWSGGFNDQARSLSLSAGATITVYVDGVGSSVINTFTNSSISAQTYTLSATSGSAFILSGGGASAALLLAQ